jgi:acetyl-CoA synthetase
VVTATGSKRGAKPISLKPIVDEALEICSKQGLNIEHCLVFDHALAFDKSSISMKQGRDTWWHESVMCQPKTSPIEWMDSEDPLFKLYTSGSTGKPKVRLHSSISD